MKIALFYTQLQKKLHYLEEQLNIEMQAKDELEQKYRSNCSRLEKITKELDEEVSGCFISGTSAKSRVGIYSDLTSLHMC